MHLQPNLKNKNYQDKVAVQLQHFFVSNTYIGLIAMDQSSGELTYSRHSSLAEEKHPFHHFRLTKTFASGGMMTPLFYIMPSYDKTQIFYKFLPI